MNNKPIGVFDSGVGGVSVLREMVRLMPNERFVYYGDDANAPYGVRDEDEIRSLTSEAVKKLQQQGIKTLVIACNTATSAAAQTLRERLDIPVVGMEPALKPAALDHRDERVLVLATPATLGQTKFRHLMELYGERALMVPCEGLMEFVQRGDLGSDALLDYLEAKLAPYREEPTGAVVLGCTHYVFLKRAIARVLPGVTQYDGNVGTARRLYSLLEQQNAFSDAAEGKVEFMSSGDASVIIPLMERLLVWEE